MAGLALFLLFNVVVVALVIRDPLAHSVVPVYRNGSLDWWQGRDIFGGGKDGFLYLPTFAVLYTPFAWLGPRMGDSLWRIGSVAVLILALWRALALAMPAAGSRRRVLILGAVLLVALPCSFGALRNGQATTLLYALMLLGAVEIAGERWWAAALYLALALSAKPLAFVMLLLVGVLYPKLSWRLGLAVAGFLLIPLLNHDPVGALHRYAAGLHKILSASEPEAGRWADLSDFLFRLGLQVPGSVMTLGRITAAAATLALAFAARRNRDPVDAAFDILALSVVYLMLMNPRTEGNTYIALGFTIGLGLAVAVHRESDRRTALWLIAIAIGFLLALAVPPDAMIRPQPMLCLIFTPLLVRRCLARSPARPAAVSIASG